VPRASALTRMDISARTAFGSKRKEQWTVPARGPKAADLRSAKVLRYKLQGADDQIGDGEAKRKGPDSIGAFCANC
jgi:hypothetical protein